ncbi:MAG: flagellar basal-body MS-ring/collar protein FliF [Pseudomonadota bacterium]
MSGLVSVWGTLTTQKKLALIAAVVATIGAFSMLARTASRPSMTLLYAGLEGRTAGDVITALEQMDVAFDVRGDAIYVPAQNRDSARMALAAKGLPQSGQAGYELLDTLNGFSTTSDMFDATYWRAKEGELARTITTTPGVSSARVHIATQSGGPFSRNAAEPTAVVTVTMGRGALKNAQANSIRYLVGSAVPGLSPESVAVLDSERGVVLSPGSSDPAMGDQEDASDREQRLESDILNILEARVGAGNARVQVALEIDREREAISERVFDPEGRVVAGREVNEVSETSTGSGGNTVTVASNLPEGEAGANGSQSSSSRTETREITTYDMSEVRREREKLPGAIQRLSIAVLVNEVADESDDGTPVLRDQAELDSLRNLVAQAAGFNEARGDTLSIEALAFKSLDGEGVLIAANPMGDFIERHLMTVIQIGVLAVVTLVLALFVVKPVLASEATGGSAGALEAGQDPMPMPAALEDLGPATPVAPPDPIELLKEIAVDKSDETADLLKTWLEAEPAEDAA